MYLLGWFSQGSWVVLKMLAYGAYGIWHSAVYECPKISSPSCTHAKQMCNTAYLPSTQPPHWSLVWEKKVYISDPSLSQLPALCIVEEISTK